MGEKYELSRKVSVLAVCLIHVFPFHIWSSYLMTSYIPPLPCDAQTVNKMGHHFISFQFIS
jgi:hypothetical protein